MVWVATRAWMTRRRRPGRVARHGSPPVARGPPVAPRPAGCPILTRERRSALSESRCRGPPAAELPLVRCATPRPPARPRRGPARTPRRRPLPLARGRRRPAHPGVDARPRTPSPPRCSAACRCARSSPPGWRSWCTPAPSASRSGGAGGPSPRAATPARSTPSCGSARPTAPSGSWSTRWPSTPRGRRRSTPGRRPGRATGWPTSSPPAATRSPGSTSSTSPPARWSTARSTAAATPPSPGCPAARSCSTSAGSPPDQVPAGEEQFHRRVWRHRVGAPADTDVLVHGEGSDPTTYFGVHTSRDGRWLVVSGSAGTAPRDDVWIADLAGDGALRDFQVGVDAQTAAWVARDGRLWLMSDRDTPRWRLAVADPADPATWSPEAWQDVVPQQAGRRPLRRRARRRPGRRPAGARRARRRRHRPALGVGRGTAPAGWPTSRGSASAASPASARRRRAAPRRGSATPTTPPRRRCCAGTPARRPTLTSWEQAAVAGEVARPDRRRDARDVGGRDAGAPVRAVRLGHARRPRPTVLYGYGGFNVSLTPAYTAQALAWVAAGGVWAVANLARRRARRGVAPRGHARAQAERVRRLRRRRGAPGRRGLDDARAARRSWAAPTAACWSARR